MCNPRPLVHFTKSLGQLLSLDYVIRPKTALLSTSIKGLPLQPTMLHKQEPRQFYRRPLPASCIAFSTSEGRYLFKEALEMGYLESFFDLVPQLRTQVQPSYCGLSALVMVLNSFEMDPGRVWMPPWRWYHEDMLTCCIDSDDLLTNGITLSQFTSIATCNGLNVELHQPTDPGESVETFRLHLKSACAQSLAASGSILVVSYDRQALKQTGSGHYALVGGYHPKRDLLLMLETAAFKYPSHWAPLTAIYNGMCSLDKVTGRPRGYMLITKAFDARTGLREQEGVESRGEGSEKAADVVDEGRGEVEAAASKVTALTTTSTPKTAVAALSNVDRLLNRLTLFCLADAAHQAFSSPASLLDSQSAGGRLRSVADDWCMYLATARLSDLGQTCCCLLQQTSVRVSHSHPGDCLPGACSSPRAGAPRAGRAFLCECPCLVDSLLDHLLALLVKHRPPDFFFSCQPLWPDFGCGAGTVETATQVIFELVSSATGRRARLALERLPQRSYEWLTSDSGGPMTYRAVSTLNTGVGSNSSNADNGGTSRRPACAMPLVTDPKIRATALLTAFILAFPYHTVLPPWSTVKESVAPTSPVHVLHSSEYMLQHLPQRPGQTCFAALLPGTQNELTTLSKILAQLVAIRRPLGTRCIDNRRPSVRK